MSRWSFDLTEAPPPDAAVEVASRHVSAATIGRRGGQPIVSAYAIEPLPEGAVVPSLTAQNIRDRALVGAAVARALEAVGRPKRVGLVVPDQVARAVWFAITCGLLVLFVRWCILAIPGRRKSTKAMIWAAMAADEVLVRVDVGQGTGSGEAFGCDLSEEYVIENSEYST